MAELHTIKIRVGRRIDNAGVEIDGFALPRVTTVSMSYDLGDEPVVNVTMRPDAVEAEIGSSDESTSKAFAEMIRRHEARRDETS